jgi:hypothetical protein
MFAHVFKANPYHDHLGRFSDPHRAQYVSLWGKGAAPKAVLPEVKYFKSGQTQIFEYHFGGGAGSGIGGIGVDGRGRVNSSVLPVFARGKGLGKAMYKQVAEHLARNGMTLSSGMHTSEEAARVWDSLVREGVAETDGRGWRMKGPNKPLMRV